MDHASLCFLSYNRPLSLNTAVKTALYSPGWPVEVIIHDDGSDHSTQASVTALAIQSASVAILNRSGNNEGVGRAINRAFSVATGRYLVKIDQDLVFNPGWLAQGIRVLEEDPTVGMVGFFKYLVDPVDWTKMELEQGDHSGRHCPNYHYVKDFVSSIFLIERATYDVLGPLPEYSAAFAEDIEYKNRIKNELGLKLALLDVDVCKNVGFGIGPSTVVTRDGSVQKINKGPWLR